MQLIENITEQIWSNLAPLGFDTRFYVTKQQFGVVLKCRNRKLGEVVYPRYLAKNCSHDV